MNEINRADGEPRPVVVFSAFILGALFAICVCLICWLDAGRPMGMLRVWQTEEAEEPPILIEEILKTKGFLKIAGAVPGIKTRPFRLRVGLVSENGNEMLLMHTQMVRRDDIKKLYHRDDHCGFAATLSLRDMPSGTWQVVLVLGNEGEETVRLTNRFVSKQEET